MTLIKCPQCGQTVLSVATTCPKCHHLLVQNPMQHGGESDFVECRRCGKMIPRHTVTCEYCGYPVRLRRRIRRIVWSTFAGVALIAVAVAAYQIQGGTRTAAPEATQAATPPAPPSGGFAPPAVERRPPVAVDTVRPAPDSTTAPAVPAATARPPRVVPRDAHTRWTISWANIRVARDTVSAVVRPVPPGTPLLAAQQQNGWWAVYDDSVLVGYMAGDLLRSSPDDTIPNRFF